MNVQIITDSYSGITQQEAQRLGILLLPMPFTVDGTEYLEGSALDHSTLFEKLAGGAEVSTSQSSPKQVMALWNRALQTHGQVVYIPLSSGLSGACATARAMAMDAPYEGRVFVVDTGRISTPLYRSVLDALALAEAGYNGAQIQRELETARENMSIYVAASTLEYLKRGGRISATSAAVGTLLGIRPVLRLHVGVLTSYRNPRGLRAAKRTMLNALRHDLETKFSDWYDKGNVHILAASNTSEAATKQWISEIEDAFPGISVQYSPLPMGVSCHIGPDALGIGCSCVPDALLK